METLSELYENGYFSPKLITEVTIPQWAKLLDYRDPITGIYAIIDSDGLRKLLPNVREHNITACSINIISDTNEVEFFDKCYNENMFAIVHTGKVKIRVITSTRTVTYNNCVAYKVHFVAMSEEDDNSKSVAIANIAKIIVSTPNVDISYYPESLPNISLTCDVSGDPDLIDDINSKTSDSAVVDFEETNNKPSIFGFFGNYVKRKTDSIKNLKQVKQTADKATDEEYPNYDIL